MNTHVSTTQLRKWKLTLQLRPLVSGVLNRILFLSSHFSECGIISMHFCELLPHMYTSQDHIMFCIFLSNSCIQMWFAYCVIHLFKVCGSALALAAHTLKLERYREDQHGPCTRMTLKFMKHSIFLATLVVSSLPSVFDSQRGSLLTFLSFM